MADFKEQFGERLRNLRRDRGLSQAELGELSGINDKYLGEIERGAGNPSLEVMVRLAQGLGVSLATLAGDEIAAMGRAELLAEVAFHTATMTDDQLQRLVRVLRVGTHDPQPRAN